MLHITALENNVLAFWNISRIHFGYSKSDFNYCSKNYILKSFDGDKPGEYRMKVSKQFGTGKMKDLDIHLYDYGDDIIRINIDDDSDGKSTRFKIPFTP